MRLFAFAAERRLVVYCFWQKEDSVRFFKQTEFVYYPTDCINIPVLLLESESEPIFLNSSVDEESVTVKTVLPLSVPAFVRVDAVCGTCDPFRNRAAEFVVPGVVASELYSTRYVPGCKVTDVPSDPAATSPPV